ncbi:putative transcriptional regulator [Myroides gitamensis]|nr:putative transcriptional regulator [Myroides odoratus]MDH6600708.1 putative transcriptional regulator [Myroides gitamensis]
MPLIVNNLQLQMKDLYFIFTTLIVSYLQIMENKENKELSFDFDFLDKLVVGIGEVAQITGIPTRQIRYWEEKGIISSLTEEEGKNRRYNYENIKKMLLIKELMEEGYTLDASAEKVKKRMEMIEATLNKLRQP